MFGALATLVISLAVSSSALVSAHPRNALNHHKRDKACTRRDGGYKLQEVYEGKSFFDGFDFYSDDDPTHGLVNYLPQNQASKLAYVQDDNTVVMAVDDFSDVPVGGKRDSVRISSKKAYSDGLFILDVYAMPHGCSVWPAYWMVGNDVEWPNGGEIDIIENVNEATQNQVTLHTGPGCSINKGDGLVTKTLATVSTLFGTECASSDGNNAGCAFGMQDNSSYGHGFNHQAGGVYAHTLEDDGIKVWFFTRGQIPADITARKPDPSTWPTPVAAFPSTDCNIKEHFKAQNIIFDITLCGDWAGAAYSSSGCPGSCEQAVADKTNFQVAQWQIASLQVYQK
ncbi:glycoside hydrolase family 16 protein [Trametes elegans]|nr:glycoside hydrolase family 16 protein [Trametes elegans]